MIFYINGKQLISETGYTFNNKKQSLRTFNILRSMREPRNLRVFVMEDEEGKKEKIKADLKDLNYQIYFFSKNESVFDLIKFNPDIVIQDYYKNKVLNLHEWAVPI